MSKSNAKAAAARLKKLQEQESKYQEPTNETSSALTEGAAPPVGENDPEQAADPQSNSVASDESEPETVKPAEQSAEVPKSDTETGADSKDKTTDLESQKPQVADDNKLVQVEFVGPYKRYSKGDIAAFTKSVAKELIEKGAAVRPGETYESEKEPV